MPKRTLTALSIPRIKLPAAGQVDHFDRGYPGLALRVSYGGSRSWVFFYRIGKRQRRLTLGTFPAMDLAEAREAWRKAREDVARGRDPAHTKQRDAGANDFASVVQEWLKRDQGDNRSRDEIERVVNRELIPAWGHRLVGDIGRRDIRDLIDGIADRGAVTMSRRVQAYVHRFFRWCVGRDIIEANPASDLPKHGDETKRDRVLSDKEVIALWKAAGEIGWPFGPAVRLLLLTGARREQIGALCWSEIRGQPEKPAIELPSARTKNAEPLIIPVSKTAFGLIENLPRVGNSDLVFTTNGKTPISGWSRAKRELDRIMRPASPWRIHDLRRTASTGMNELGIEPHIVEAILGHKVRGVAGVYNRAKYETLKRAALEAWGAHVMALIEGNKRGVVVALRAAEQ